MSIFKKRLKLETLCDFYYGNVLTKERDFETITNSLPGTTITNEGLLRITKNQEIYHLVTFNVMLIIFALDGSIFIDPNYLLGRLMYELDRSISKLEHKNNLHYQEMFSNIEEDILYLSKCLSSDRRNDEFFHDIANYLIDKYNIDTEFNAEENIFIRLSTTIASTAAINNSSKFRIVK